MASLAISHATLQSTRYLEPLELNLVQGSSDNPRLVLWSDRDESAHSLLRNDESLAQFARLIPGDWTDGQLRRTRRVLLNAKSLHF